MAIEEPEEAFYHEASKAEHLEEIEELEFVLEWNTSGLIFASQGKCRENQQDQGTTEGQRSCQGTEQLIAGRPRSDASKEQPHPTANLQEREEVKRKLEALRYRDPTISEIREIRKFREVVAEEQYTNQTSDREQSSQDKHVNPQTVVEKP